MSEITSCLAGPAPVIPTPEVESRVASGLERKEALTAPRGSLSILSCSHHSWARSEQVRAGPGCRGSRDPLPSPESSLDGLGPHLWGTWENHWAGTRSRPSHQPAALLTRSTSLGLGGWTEA